MSLALNYGYESDSNQKTKNHLSVVKTNPTKTAKTSKVKKDIFTSSIETIYCKQPTEKLEAIFAEKKLTYNNQTKFYQDTTVRYKELEILRVLRKELSKRDIAVSIFD